MIRSGGTPIRPLLLCMSHLPWDLVLQRPQHLLTRAAQDWRVVYFEEPRYEPPGPNLPRLDRREVAGGVEVAVPVLPYWDGVPGSVERMQRPLLDALLAEAGQPDVLWYYTPLAQAVAGHLSPGLVVYDCMDELSAFRGASPQMLIEERRLMRRADLVFTGGQSLYEAKRSIRHDVHCFPSSIDAGHFARARAGEVPEPPELRDIPGPRIGWFGVVDERLDLELLAACARLRPDWSFVMIGPVVKIDPADLPRLANIHWLGGRSYADLPAHLAHWDAGLMPFAINEATRFISPTKTPEYLAAGVPVVSTAIADVIRPWGEEGLVEIAETAEAAIASLQDVLVRPRGPWLEAVDQQLSQISWDKTWNAMSGLISKGRAGLALESVRSA
ncbi:glycosyltransferase [Pararoseomonas indoligenes]|uniref:Glycosyltransferase n=1 Tax=Roseomonas indoligenes TaxID=2820811 RepID=A0A940N7M6_9PROT|nr:glycosyltransferase [Pararoseomonas indoligenes]MBP0495577.1 glycosyltransferase [Pararoseomonas indoligenes]